VKRETGLNSFREIGEASISVACVAAGPT